MKPEEIHAQREMDEEILYYVRGMQTTAPVRAESVHGYLVKIRRRRVTDSMAADRLGYLVDRGFLAVREEWAPGEGEVRYFEITADGRDVLDGVRPWE